jgi:hypothetical protein
MFRSGYGRDGTGYRIPQEEGTMDNRIPKEEWADFLAPFKCQLTVCWPKLSDAQGFAKQTVHYFCRLVKGAQFLFKFRQFLF